VVLSARAAELAEAQGIDRIDIPLSHDAGLAMAVAAAVPRETDETDPTHSDGDDE
jgi:hypothetical protein